MNDDKLKEVGFRHSILEGLMYSASDRGQNKLPSKWEFITSEIVGAVYEYLTGDEFKQEYREHRGPYDDHWVDIVNKHLLALDGQRRFSQSLAGALLYWLHLDWKYDRGESWWEGQIRHWFLFGFRQGFDSTFALTVPEAKQFEEGLQKLDSDTRRHLENIAEIMKKYVQRDIEYIERHY